MPATILRRRSVPSSRDFSARARRTILLVVAWLLALLAPATLLGDERFEMLLRGGRVIDGTGAPWYDADVAIRGGRIAAIGKLAGAEATRLIDVSGLYVAPGFIDMMGQ